MSRNLRLEILVTIAISTCRDSSVVTLTLGRPICSVALDRSCSCFHSDIHTSLSLYIHLVAVSHRELQFLILHTRLSQQKRGRPSMDDTYSRIRVLQGEPIGMRSRDEDPYSMTACARPTSCTVACGIPDPRSPLPSVE